MSIFGVENSTVSSNFLGMMQSSSSKAGSVEDFASAILKQDDADGNGLLSLEETPLDEQRFDLIDSDGDGYLSAEELSADAKAHMEKQSLMGQLSVQMYSLEEMVEDIFAQDDADGDGLLSFEETPLSQEMFESMDADGDGYLTTDELSAGLESGMPEAMLANAEATGTAQTTGSAQAAGSPASSGSDDEEDYDELDLNQDGTVSMDELFQAYQNGEAKLQSVFSNMGEGLMTKLSERFAMNAYHNQMSLA